MRVEVGGGGGAILPTLGWGKQRANGEGSIRKRKDGRWEGRYTAGHDPETGKAIYKNVLGKTQAEVKEKLKQAIGEAQALDITKAGKYTVEEWMEVWFQDYAKIKVRPSSHQTYQGYIHNHIRPNIGDIPLEKLTSLDLQKFYKKLLTTGRVDRVEAKGQPKGLSAKTVRNIHQILSSARRQPRTTAPASLCGNFPPILRCSFLQYMQYCCKSAPRLDAKFTRKSFLSSCVGLP